jgi:Transglutaminase-like superfamily
MRHGSGWGRWDLSALVGWDLRMDPCAKARAMLKSILREQQLRDIRLWQRTKLVPQAMVVAGHEMLAKSFAWKERGSRRTAFLLGNEAMLSVALLAVMRRGDSAVLNPTLAPAEITDVLKRTTPRLIITSTEHLPKLQQLADVGKQIEEICLHPFGNIVAFDVCLDEELVTVRDDEFVCQLTSGVNGKPRIVSRTYRRAPATESCDQKLLLAVRRALTIAACNVLWSVVCLPKAIAAKAMLARHRCGSAFHLGATFDSNGRLIACLASCGRAGRCWCPRFGHVDFDLFRLMAELPCI